MGKRDVMRDRDAALAEKRRERERQPELDFYAPHNHTPTSKAAARDVEPRVASMEATVLTAIRRAHDGMTDDEVEAATGLRHQTASARRRGLVLKGLVVDSGRRRPTRSGSMAVVWVARVV